MDFNHFSINPNIEEYIEKARRERSLYIGGLLSGLAHGVSACAGTLAHAVSDRFRRL